MAKRSGSCLGKLLKKICVLLFCLCVFATIIGDDDDANTASTATKATAAPTAALTSAPTKAPTEQPTTIPTKKPTEAPTSVPTEAPLVIVLTYPELGEYGEYYTFNANVAKAEESDKETIIQCYVPAGKYTLTNEGQYPTFVFIYSRKTVISSFGWEEPAETWTSQMLQVGDSCDIEIKEDHYINLQENNVFKLVQK